MSIPIKQLRAVCPQCRHEEIWGLSATIQCMVRSGVLKRSTQSAPQSVFELAVRFSDRLRCKACGRLGLAVSRFEERPNTGDWLEARICESCGKPIPAERVAAVPDVRYCIGCQQEMEDGFAF